MNRSLFACLLSLFIIRNSSAQTPSSAGTQPYGKIDKTDLELKSCDFEPDANAMVLFNKADVYYVDAELVADYHKRIKIFNENGKGQANIRIPYISGYHTEFITDIEAETINLVDGKEEVTKLDRKFLYNEDVDKFQSAYVFAFPNVKPGSIIEYKYKWHTEIPQNFPSWAFQSDLPVRYSEFDTQIYNFLLFKTKTHTYQPFVKYTHVKESNYYKDTRAMANLHSLPDEPFMTSRFDNLQSILYTLSGILPSNGVAYKPLDTWPKIGTELVHDDDFGLQLKRKLESEDSIVNKAKAIKTDNDKMAYVFGTVKNAMKWDGIDRWYTNDGVSKAWTKKTGNSTEINLILYHLLKQSGVKAYPLLISTRSHGKVNPAYPFLYQFNRTAVYVPIDSAHYYIMDATGKYNVYNQIPDELLNTYAFSLDKESNMFKIFFVDNPAPAKQMGMITAEIKPDGKMEGTVQLSSYGYNRTNSIKRYKTDGEQKYISLLQDHNNNLKISSVKFENMEVDTVPLVQNIDFKLDLPGSDGTYIYVNTNLFTSVHDNPFLSEERFSDIDLAYRSQYAISGVYKIPSGYKPDAIPQATTLVMPDQSIVFRRMVVQQDGSVMVRYTIDYRKTLYNKEDYPQLHDFYKKMHEMLDEQIVLKKG